VPFGASGFFVLRVPSLSIEEFWNWSSLSSSGAQGSVPTLQSSDGIARDRDQLCRRLKALIRRPQLREAILLASPSLDETIDRWIHGDLTGRRAFALERTLARYFTRMCTRATPFGLFAGVAVGDIRQTFDITLGTLQSRRHTRLDQALIDRLVDALCDQPQVQSRVRYLPNSTSHAVDSRVYYAEMERTERAVSYRLVACEATHYLLATLQRAGSGASIDELAAPLTDDTISLSDAGDFVTGLIDAQLLVPELRTGPTTANPLGHLTRSLMRINASDSARAIAVVAAELAQLDASEDSLPRDRYQRAIQPLSELVELPTDSSPFHVDLFWEPSKCELSVTIAQDLLQAAAILAEWGVAASDDKLTEFRDRFVARYGHHQRVPLLEALDEDRGVGIEGGLPLWADPSGIVAQVSWPSPSKRWDWSTREHALLHKLVHALASGQTEIEISGDEPRQLGIESRQRLPDAFSVMASVIGSKSAVADGRYRVLVHGLSGPSGVNLLARSCHGHQGLAAHVRRHIAAEEALRPEAVFAEIVHTPEGRVNNITGRPVLRSFEVPYGAASGVAPAYQIPVTDLDVTVADGRLALWSRRLMREVIPRLSSAHNFQVGAVPVYWFLCALQQQGVVSGSWNWGPLLASPYLPRVISGRLILSRAKWGLFAEDLRALDGMNRFDQFALVQKWRADRGLPRVVALAAGDQELILDLDNVLCVENLVHVAKQVASLVLKEAFVEPNDLSVTRSDGSHFTHELVVPFVRRSLSPTAAPRRSAPVDQATARKIVPDRECLYIKLYTGQATADELLTSWIPEAIEKAKSSRLLSHWFFVRFADPDWHIRLRLFGPSGFLRELRREWSDDLRDLVSLNRLWRVDFSTYDRELERYGGSHGVELAEQAFHADSEFVLAALRAHAGDAGLQTRWQLALHAMDVILQSHNLQLNEKHNVARRLRDNFAAEFGGSRDTRVSIGRVFRNERSVAPRGALADNLDSALVPAANRYRRKLSAIGQRVSEAARIRSLSVPISEFAANIMHMHANRLFRANARAHERVLYDFLDRVYWAELAHERAERSQE
jgi:lantibiotic biosynthesis protein